MFLNTVSLSKSFLDKSLLICGNCNSTSGKLFLGSRKGRRILVCSGILLFILLLLGNSVVNTYIGNECRQAIASFVESELKRRISIGSSTFGITGISLNDVVVYEGMNSEKPFLSVGEITLQTDLLQSFLSHEASISKVLVRNPRLQIRLAKDGTFNVEEFNKKNQGNIKGLLGNISGIRSLRINEFAIENGLVDFWNEASELPLKDISVSGIEGNVSGFHGTGKISSRLDFVFAYESKKAIIGIVAEKENEVSPATLRVDVSNLDVAPFRDFLQKAFPLQEGVIDSNLAFSVANASMVIESKGVVTLKHCKGREGGNMLPPLIHFNPNFSVNLDTSEVVLSNALLSIPNAGEIQASGNLTAGKQEIQLQSKNFDVASYFRSVGTVLPKSRRIMVDSSLSVKGIDGRQDVSINGDIEARNEDGYGIKAQATSDYRRRERYANITVANLVVTKPRERKPMLKIGKGVFSKVAVSSGSARIASISLQSPDLRVTAGKENELDILEAFRSFLGKPTSSSKAKQAFGVKVKNLSVENGKLSYWDESDSTASPQVSLSNVEMSIKNIEPETKAQVELDGRIQSSSDTASVYLDGDINPFTLEAKNLRLKVSQLQLKDFSDLARKTANASIQEGEMDLLVKTDIDKESNFKASMNFEIWKLRMKFPSSEDTAMNLFLDSLRRNGDIISLKDINLSGNIAKNNYDLASFKSAVVKQSLSSKQALGAVTGTAVIGVAAAPVILPLTAIAIAGSAIYEMFTNQGKESKRK